MALNETEGKGEGENSAARLKRQILSYFSSCWTGMGGHYIFQIEPLAGLKGFCTRIFIIVLLVESQRSSVSLSLGGHGSKTHWCASSATM